MAFAAVRLAKKKKKMRRMLVTPRGILFARLLIIYIFAPPVFWFYKEAAGTICPFSVRATLLLGQTHTHFIAFRSGRHACLADLIKPWL